MKRTHLKILATCIALTSYTSSFAVPHCQYTYADEAMKCLMTATEMQQGLWRSAVKSIDKNHLINFNFSAFYIYYDYQQTPDNKENPNHVDYDDIKNVLIHLKTNFQTITCRADQVIIGECYGYGKLNSISFDNANPELLNKLPMAMNIG